MTGLMPIVLIEREYELGGFRQVVTWPTDDAVDICMMRMRKVQQEWSLSALIFIFDVGSLQLQLARVQGEEQHRRQHPPRSTAPNQHEGGVFLRLLTEAARPCTGGQQYSTG